MIQFINRGGSKKEEKKEYIELEYIKTTGTQFIDTEIKLTNNMSFEITLKDNGSGDWNIYYGDGSQNIQCQNGDRGRTYLMWRKWRQFWIRL